jgi:hypothetical protein
LLEMNGAPNVFVDVPDQHWAAAWINELYHEGITSGCSENPLSYCPEENVTRAQMAIFILRSMHGSTYVPPSSTSSFSDVPSSYWAAAWINELYHEGITSGCGVDPLVFCPDQTVTRAQMAVFLLRAKHGSTYLPPDSANIFSDVDSQHWAKNWINQFYTQGFTHGCTQNPLSYCPDNNVTRAEMSIFLLRVIHGISYEPPPTGSAYYVAPTGNDTNPGTMDEPWQTIQHAADTLVAGNTVYIRAGTYYERVFPANSGSEGNIITYAAYPGETVTINGTGVEVLEYNGLFDLTGRSYIRVSGLRVINSAYYGILAVNSGHITIEHNYTHNTYSSGISAWDSHHIIVDHNEVTGACTGIWQESLSISNTDTFEVRYNLVHDVMPGTNGKEGITIKDSSTHGKVYGNEVYNLYHVGLYVDAEAGHLSDVEVYQNVVHNIEAMGFSLASEQGGLLENIRLYNNISYDNLVGLWLSACCTATHPFKDITIINNTFAYNGRAGWGGGIGIENLQVQNVIIRNNISSRNTYGQMTGDHSILPALTVDHNLTDGDRDPDYEFYGVDDLVGMSPLFANPLGADFHLGSSSPAIDSGSSQNAPATDFNGNFRPQDGNGDGTSQYDIGAYEFVVSMKTNHPNLTARDDNFLIVCLFPFKMLY